MNRAEYCRKRLIFWPRTGLKNDQYRTTQISLWDHVFLNSLVDGSCLLCEGQRRTVSLYFGALFMSRPAMRLDTITLANLTDSCLELCPQHFVVVSRLRDTLLSEPVTHTPRILTVLRLEKSLPQMCSACDIEKETASRFTKYVVHMARSRQTFQLTVCEPHYRTLVEAKTIMAGSWIPRWNAKHWWHVWLSHNCRIVISPCSMTTRAQEEQWPNPPD